VRLTWRRPLVLGSFAAAFLAIGVLVGLGLARAPAGAAAEGAPDGPLRGLEGVLGRQGLAAALDSLELLAAQDSAVLRDGHQIAHALGRDAVAAHGGDAAIIRECRPVFASGCYHGVVEAALHAAGRIDMVQLERLCVGVEGPAGPGPGFECVHGLGHGILGAHGYDLAATLRDCDALSSPRYAGSCHLGAFMEAISAAVGAPMPGGMHMHAAGHAHPATQPLAIDPADPYSPCDGFREPYAPSCWLFQGFVILRANDFDAGRALRVCDDAPDGRAERCYEGVGHQVTGLFQRDDAWILEQCGKGRPDLAPWCAGGAALALDAIDWSGTRAARLCAAAPGAWKDRCYRTASGALIDLATPAQRARFCSAVEADYVRSCREAGEVEAARAPR
jgi:hypothetical protein